MRNFQKLVAYTFVELIVVVMIVATLSILGFVSYSSYVIGARDANRLSQIVSISDTIETYAALRRLPLPDDYITITASGTTIGYQGYVGESVLETIGITSGGRDPEDSTYFTYYLGKDRRSAQFLALMEEQILITSLDSFLKDSPFITQSYAIDYSERYPKIQGKKIGVLLSNDSDTENTPIQDSNLGLTSLDIVSTVGDYTAYITDSETFSGTGGVLQLSIPNASCKRIKQMGKEQGNGQYSINPGGNGKIQVYCDMENDGGGWTYVARGNGGNTNASFSGVQLDMNIDCSDAGGCSGGGMGWHLSSDIINKIAYKDSNGYYETFITNSEGADIDNIDFPTEREYRFRKEKQSFTFEAVMSDFFAWNGSVWIDNDNADSGGVNDRGPAWVSGDSNYCCELNKDNCSEASTNSEGQFSHTNNNQHLRCSVADWGQNALVIFVR